MDGGLGGSCFRLGTAGLLAAWDPRLRKAQNGIRGCEMDRAKSDKRESWEQGEIPYSIAVHCPPE